MLSALDAGSPSLGGGEEFRAVSGGGDLGLSCFCFFLGVRAAEGA